MGKRGKRTKRDFRCAFYNNNNNNNNNNNDCLLRVIAAIYRMVELQSCLQNI